MQNSIFTKRGQATPYIKGGHFDSIGTVRIANEENSIGSEYVSRLEKYQSIAQDNLRLN
jgi:hypothetical protein